MIKLRLKILFQLISLFVIIMVIYLQVMGGSHEILVFKVGTIYNDVTSSLVWVENQVSLGSNETVVVKSRFYQWLCNQAAANVSH